MPFTIEKNGKIIPQFSNDSPNYYWEDEAQAIAWIDYCKKWDVRSNINPNDYKVVSYPENKKEADNAHDTAKATSSPPASAGVDPRA